MEGIVQVVGVSGFIGCHVFDSLSKAGAPVVGVSRKSFRSANLPFSSPDDVQSGLIDTGEHADVAPGVRAVIFCAGLAHVQNPADDELKDFEKVNADLPVKYAKAAVLAGARRFV